VISSKWSGLNTEVEIKKTFAPLALNFAKEGFSQKIISFPHNIRIQENHL
jgi:hypothetical protein